MWSVTWEHYLPTAAVFSVVFLLVNRFYRHATSTNGLRRPQCVPSLPFIGSLPFMKLGSEPMHAYLTKLSYRLGNVFAFYSGSSYTVVLNGVDAVKEALVKRSGDFAGRHVFYCVRHYSNTCSKGIVNGHYDSGYRRRRQFYLSTMKQFGLGNRMMESRISVEVEEIIKQIGLFAGRAFDPNDMVTRCVVNVITSIVLGQRYAYDDPKLTELADTTRRRINANIPQLEISSLLRFVPRIRRRVKALLSAMKEIRKLCEDTIKATEAADDRDSFIRRYLEKAEEKDSLEAGYDRLELRQVVVDLLIAGGTTTATTLLWMVVLLAKHHDVQDRLRAELNTVVPLSSGRLPSLSDAPNLPFTEAFILEAMRYKTIVPLALLHRTLCDTDVDGYFVPSGTTVIVNLYSAHMDPTKWSEPEKFHPERFLDPDGTVIGKENVIPFSLGKRSCFGELMARQEIFLFLTAMVQNFYFRPPEGHDTVRCEEQSALITEPAPYQVRFIPVNISDI